MTEDRSKPPEGYKEPFQIPEDQQTDDDAWFIWPDGFDTKAEAIAAQHAHADRQRSIEREAIYADIVARSKKEGAVKGDPRWYGVNIALRAIMDRRSTTATKATP